MTARTVTILNALRVDEFDLGPLTIPPPWERIQVLVTCEVKYEDGEKATLPDVPGLALAWTNVAGHVQVQIHGLQYMAWMSAANIRRRP